MLRQTPSSEELAGRLEELKERLYRFDRAVCDARGLSARLTPGEKRDRQAIVREINRVRRQMHQLVRPPTGRPVKLTLSLAPAEYRALSEAAAAAGEDLKAFALRKLTS